MPNIAIYIAIIYAAIGCGGKDGVNSSAGEGGECGVINCCGCLFRTNKQAHLVPSELRQDYWSWLDRKIACPVFCENIIAVVGEAETGGSTKGFDKLTTGVIPVSAASGEDGLCVQELTDVGLMAYPELDGAKDGCGGPTDINCCGCLFEYGLQVHIGPSGWSPGPCQSCWTFCKHVQLVSSKEKIGEGIQETYDLIAASDEECLQLLGETGLLAYPELEYSFEPEVDTHSNCEDDYQNCGAIIENEVVLGDAHINNED